ncbi:hypothetical protein [Aurantibacter sp.]|uniref:hypothetical protein n=1 Tax=Aurantibacter sp. TaxID=2807103 RepID=UPI0032671F71
MQHLIFFILMSMTITAQHEIPESINEETNIALSYYPELEQTAIQFKFKKKIKKSTMQAQPLFKTLFSKKRYYVILISEKFTIGDTSYLTKDIPKDILIGWIGHELGHIMDYQNKSAFGLIWFGIKYVFSKNHIKTAERAADTYAVNSGMENYILKTKNFILKQAGIPEKYRNRIKTLYLSPEEIMQLIEERDLNKVL